MHNVYLLTKEAKAVEYRRYIDEHISNVKKAWFNMRSNANCLMYIEKQGGIKAVEYIDSIIENHDKSKYSEEEFEGYRKNFYPIDDEEKESSREEFKKAWQHHKDFNEHHWNYWYERGIVNSMPFFSVVEMLCDHIAMSMKFGGTAIDWYHNQKKNGEIIIGEQQEEWYLTLGTMYYERYR